MLAYLLWECYSIACAGLQEPHVISKRGFNCNPQFSYEKTFLQDPVTSRFLEYLRTQTITFYVSRVELGLWITRCASCLGQNPKMGIRWGMDACIACRRLRKGSVHLQARRGILPYMRVVLQHSSCKYPLHWTNSFRW